MVSLIGLVSGIFQDFLKPLLFQRHVPTPAEVEEIRSLALLFAGKSEGELRDAFGFDEMLERNEAWLLQRYAATVLEIETDLDEFMEADSEMLLLSGGMVNMETGLFTPEDPDRVVRFVLLPKSYVAHMAELRRFASSPFLDEKTRGLIGEYIDLAEQNAYILGDVLEKAAGELPERLTKPPFAGPVIWIHNRYARRFRQLSPKAEEISTSLRSYLSR